MQVETAISKLRNEGWDVTKVLNSESQIKLEARKKGHHPISCIARMGEITSFKVAVSPSDNSMASDYNSTWVGSLNRALSLSQIWRES